MRAVLVCVVTIAGCRSGSEPKALVEADARVAPVAVEVDAAADVTASAPVDARAELPSVATDWCIEGMLGLDEDVCYVLPELRTGPRRLLVYLHGIVPPAKDSVQKQTVEGAVLNTARRAGAAAIVPRGRRGIGPEGARDWWAWPTSPKTHAELVTEIVARFAAAKKKLETIAGAPFERTYLAGSSNGAYFLSALALRGDCERLGFPIDGFGAMSGGAPGGRGADALAARPPRPFYIGFGTYDGETKAGARALAAVCEGARWPVRIAEHPFGHGAREVYLDEAFAFWDEVNERAR